MAKPFWTNNEAVRTWRPYNIIDQSSPFVSKTDPKWLPAINAPPEPTAPNRPRSGPQRPAAKAPANRQGGKSLPSSSGGKGKAKGKGKRPVASSAIRKGGVGSKTVSTRKH